MTRLLRHIQMRWMTYALLGAALMLLTTQQIDLSVGRIELAGQPAFTVSSVGNQTQARQAWCLWVNYRREPAPRSPAADGAGLTPSPDVTLSNDVATCVHPPRNGQPLVSGDATATRLVWAYATANLVLAALLLALLLTTIRRRRGSFPGGCPPLLNTATRPGVLLGLTTAAVTASVIQSASQMILAHGGAASWWIGAAGTVLQFAPLSRSMALATLALLALSLWLAPHFERKPKRLPRLTRAAREPVSQAGRTAALLRLQVVVTLILVVPVLGVANDQAPDVLLRLLDVDGSPDRLVLGIAGLAFTLVGLGILSTLLWFSVPRAIGQQKLTRKAIDAERPPQPELVWAGAFVAFVAAFAWPRWSPLIGLGLVLAAIAVLSAISGVWRTERGYEATTTAIEERSNGGALALKLARRFGHWLAAVPIAVVGLELARVATPALIVEGGWRFATLVALGLVLIVVAAVLPALLRIVPGAAAEGTGDKAPVREKVHAALFGITAVAYVLVCIPATHLAEPALVGPIGMASLFLGFVLVVLNSVQRWADRTVPPAGLRLLNFQRIPVFALAALWLALGSAFNSAGSHAVRVLTDGSPAQLLSAHDAYNAWAGANCVDAGTPADGEVPMVFVASSGGGIRAAYWTADVMNRLFPLDRQALGCDGPAWSRLFAISGISGGSLGVESYLTSTEDRSNRPWFQRAAITQASTSTPWFEEALGVDHLSGVFSWMLYVDSPRAFIGFPGDDRAAVIEESWESSDAALGDPFFQNYGAMLGGRAHGWVPLALLNGAAVESGCQTLTAPVTLNGFGGAGGKTPSSDPLACRAIPSSNVATEPAPAVGLTNLAGTYICVGSNGDVRRSTAALLSARFPYVTPSGRLTNCTDPAVNTFVADGGYVDGLGANSAVALYEQVRRLVASHNDSVGRSGSGRRIRPIFVQIDNGYLAEASSPAPGRPPELLVPPLGKLAASDASENTTSQRAFSAFGSCWYARIADVPVPGVEAPLGWVLSTSARDDLDEQAAMVTAAKALPTSLTWARSGAHTVRPPSSACDMQRP